MKRLFERNTNSSVHPKAAPRDYPELNYWLFSILFLAWHLWPVLSERQLAGWDLTSHLYLYKEMLTYLRASTTHGYDFNWFAGFPAFVLYPPLFYILCALPHFLSFGLISEILSFNVVMFALPGLLLVSVYLATRNALGQGNAKYALIFGLLFLALPRDFAHYSVGLLGLFAVGLPSAFLATIFIALLLAVLEHARQPHSARLWPAAITILVAAIITTHVLLAIFAAWLLILYIIARSRLPRVRTALAALIGVVIASPWWVPFVQAVRFSSGASLGLPGDQPDPFLVLFPGIIARSALDFLSLDLKWFHFGSAASLVSIPLPVFVLHFPIIGLLTLSCTLLGISSLLRRREYFFPATYLLTLFLLPRNLLTQIFSDGLHTYRFVQPLFILQIILCSAGLAELRDLQHRVSALTRGALRASGAAAGVILLICLFAGFTMTPTQVRLKDPFKEFVIPDLTYKFHLDEYPDGKAADELIDYIKTHPPAGRIAADSAEPLFGLLGSPHYFLSQIPLKTGLPVVSGLLVESSLTAGFVVPTLHGVTFDPNRIGHMLWGRNHLSGLESFKYQTADEMLDRLSLYGVEYFVSAIYESRRSLEESDRVTPVVKTGPFSLYRLKSFAAPLLESTYQPFLFLDQGGMDFRTFSEQWFCHTELFDRPVIYSDTTLSALPQADRERFGGYIVSWNRKQSFAQEDYDQLAALKKPVIILNAAPFEVDLHSSDITFVPDFSPWSGHERFVDLYSKASTAGSTRSIPFQMGADRLEFVSSAGVLINFSYFPGWQRSNGPVYWATPSVMWIFGHGKEALSFGK